MKQNHLFVVEPASARASVRRASLAVAVVAALVAASFPLPAQAAGKLRVATFNLALFDRAPGAILARLQSGDDPQIKCLAEIIQRVRPDVLVLNEIDYDVDGAVLDALCDKYLAVGQHASHAPEGPAEPIEFAHRMAFAANTGEHSGFDLDRNGQIEAALGSRDYGGDCWGYGIYPGEYAFAVLSKYPIDKSAVREFRKFLWKDMPGAQLPDDPATPAPADWCSPEILAQFRLSSKNHCDVPIAVEGRTIHLLLSHPTPPVFDGEEDRNGRRNHDELRFWKDYIGPAAGADYLVDDAGQRGGLSDQVAGGQRSEAGGQMESDSDAPTSDLSPPTSFIILGDLNGDPHDGQSNSGIIELLAAPQILKYPTPSSLGGAEAARLQGGVNSQHTGDPAEDTEDAADDPAPGNLHLDYLLPSTDLAVTASGVFWPAADHPLAPLVAGAERPASSDHRLVWIDVTY